MEKKGFKECPMCHLHWRDINKFLADRTLEFDGYEAYFEDLEEGLLFFTHLADGCHSTLAMKAKDFDPVYTGEKYNELKFGSEECPGFCLDRNNTEKCGAHCKGAWVREIIQVIKEKLKVRESK